MRKAQLLLAGLVLIVLATASLTGCSKQPSAASSTKNQVQQQTQQTQASVDATLNAVQDKVTQLAATVGGLDARVKGLQLNSSIQDVQRKLTDAIGQVGDAKQTAIDGVSTALNNLIQKVDTAAAKLPQGGPVQTALSDFSTKLKDAQASVASVATSSTTTP